MKTNSRAFGRVEKPDSAFFHANEGIDRPITITIALINLTHTKKGQRKNFNELE